MKILTVLILLCPLWVNAFTTECADQPAGYKFKIESEETIAESDFGVFSFPENAAVTVTETLGEFTRHFTGHIIFQNIGFGVTKHARMAHYIFKLKESNQQGSVQSHSLILSVNGIDEFRNRLQCFWP